MKRIEEYVERNFEDIPDSECKEQLKQEILQNLNEKVFDLMQQGKTEEDAENKTIVEFGDIEDIKQELKNGFIVDKLLTNNKYALQLGFSIWGSALIIALVLFINFYYSPSVLWFIYPTFGILWWPLAMFFRWLKYK
jgi:hypothetical protein